MPLPSTSRIRSALLAASILTAGACTAGSGDKAAADSAASAGGAGMAGQTMRSDSAGGMAGMNHDSSGAMNHAGMGNMTGDPDRDFLRMMSDHHKGMITMAHMTIEGAKKGSAAVQADAKKVDAKQDAEVDEMITKLEQQYKDPYDPKISPADQAMVDQLKAQTGTGYDRMFYQHAVKHHQQALMMIDQALTTLKDPQVKAMAERMKRDQTREISEFQRKASKN